LKKARSDAGFFSSKSQLFDWYPGGHFLFSPPGIPLGLSRAILPSLSEFRFFEQLLMLEYCSTFFLSSLHAH
jgi:hypothetical protein